MKKLLFSIFLAFICFISLRFPSCGAGEPSYGNVGIMTENLLHKEVFRIIQNGNAFVSAKQIAEVLELKLEWVEHEAKVVLKNRENLFEIYLKERKISHNHSFRDWDGKIIVYENQTYIPFRTIAEDLGFQVIWVGEMNMVVVSKDENWISETVHQLEIKSLTDGYHKEGARWDYFRMDLEGAFSHRWSMMEDPHLLILDISSEKNTSMPRISAKHLRHIKGFKVQELYDGTFRVVLYMEEAQDYFLDVTENSLELFLGMDALERRNLRNMTSRGSAGRLEEDATLGEGEEESKTLDANNPDVPLRDLLIVIDPGHGGREPGATAGGVMEKDLNLDVSFRLSRILQDKGARTFMTRQSDVFVSLSDRAKMANDMDAQLFISVHNNALTPSANGTETLYNEKDRGLSKSLAIEIQKQLMHSLGLRDRGIVERQELAVLRRTKMPAVIVEPGFISNRLEREFLLKEDTKDKVAMAIYEGILEYLKVQETP
jgi:N-acetylmuramoyl-L-alanine amidase